MKDITFFEKWWNNFGSGILPKKDDDFESHAKNVCKIMFEENPQGGALVFVPSPPKVVKPTMKRHVSGPLWLCTCDTILDGIAHFNFCPWCGAKLDWDDQ